MTSYHLTVLYNINNYGNHLPLLERRLLTSQEKQICARVWSIRFDRGEDWAIRQLEAIDWDVDLDEVKIDAKASSQGEIKIAELARKFGKTNSEVWELLDENEWDIAKVRDRLTASPAKNRNVYEQVDDGLPDCPAIDGSAFKLMTFASRMKSRLQLLKRRLD